MVGLLILVYHIHQDMGHTKRQRANYHIYVAHPR